MSAEDYDRDAADAEDRWHEEFGAVPSLLEFQDLADVVDEVDAAGPPRYLMHPVWAEGDYGMVAAVDKAGKSWLSTDAAVSVASATPWLGIFAVQGKGPVVAFVGEGGKRKFVRRMRAICRSRDIDVRALPIRVCMRVPRLTSAAAMALVESEVAYRRPKLIIIDPLYLAARGANGADLYAMGEHLESAQVIAQRHGSALMILHHWNQTGTGRGAIRMSGAGPSAWGRVLVSAAVVSRRTDPTSAKTTVVLDLDIQGDEVADQTIRIRREVWADDPGDLSSALHYEVTQLELDAPEDPRTVGLRPSAGRVLHVLEETGEHLSVRSIGDVLAVDPTGAGPLKADTIGKALKELDEADLVDCDEPGAGRARLWWASAPESDPENDF